MGDLILAGAWILACCAACGRLGWRLGRAPLAATLGAGAAMLAIGAHVLWGDALALTRICPWSAAILATDWLLPACALLGGVAAARAAPGWRRALVPALLAAVVAVRTGGILAGPVPPCVDRWQDGVCRQSALNSCAPAAAATLLATLGVPASEPGMAELCLCRERGTPALGLYRGLSLRGAEAGLRVDCFAGTVADLRRPGQLPALLLVGLPRRAGIDPRYEREWGWTPGLPHAVVAFAIDGEWIEIGDPSTSPGRERWPVTALDVLWAGQGLRLVRR